MTNTTEASDLLIRQACTQCVDHPGWIAAQDRPDGRYVGELCPACQGTLTMVQPVSMPTTEQGKGWRTNTPWTSPSDLAFYEALTDSMKAELKDEWGTIATKYHDQGTLVGGEDGWSEGFCTDCDEDVETASVIYNLRWESGSDQPQWDESAEICTDCGETIYFRYAEEAREAAREAAAERAWEMRREEGWV